MNFLSKLFAKLTALLTGGSTRTVDVSVTVLERYPDAIYIKDVFPKSAVNVEFVILPSVTTQGLPADLADVIKKKDGFVTVVFTGGLAQTVAGVKADPTELAKILGAKLLDKTGIDEALAKIMAKLVDTFNAVLPGKPLTEAALQKKVLGMAAVFLGQSDTFASAQDFYSALLGKIIVDGNIKIALPDTITDKLSKLGLSGLTQKSDVAAVAVKLLEAQINTLLESALKGLSGDMSVY